MLIYLRAWGIYEGIGKRCGVEAITGFVCLGADLRKGGDVDVKFTMG